jgi:pSer/pThr/pTyr-binding forkhead associated (FHA) protein
MGNPPVALLFMPPWEPIRLRPDRTIVIGRSPSCDLPVPSTRVSRRHAWVHPEGSKYAVADLGSTNGTFVNEQRVNGDRILLPGDQIRVGEHTITYCVMEPGASAITADDPDGSATTTMLAAAPGTSDALQGDLSQIPAFALLQMLDIGQKSGVLSVRSPAGSCRIWLVAGKPVHAEHGSKSGFDAAVEIARMAAGRFQFEPGGYAVDHTIAVSMPELLLEASRRLDEAYR